jgi:serine protease Do
METTFATLPGLANAFTTIAAQLRQVTVQIWEPHTRHRPGQAVGSGVLWQSDGLIITNAHVVNGTTAQVALADGQRFTARVTARNRLRDLVALQIQTDPGASLELPAATIGNPAELDVGALVLAVGNPGGQVGVVTTGIIHSLGNASPSGQAAWIQADIALAPGNSGGPLANARGEVVGINTQIAQGKGLAIPVTVVQRFLAQPSQQPYLGVSLQPVMVAAHPHRRWHRRNFGLLVTEVEPDSPAAAAGVKLGDILLGVRGTEFQAPQELWQILENSQVGDSLSLDMYREGQTASVTVVLWNRVSPAQAA